MGKDFKKGLDSLLGETTKPKQVIADSVKESTTKKKAK